MAEIKSGQIMTSSNSTKLFNPNIKQLESEITLSERKLYNKTMKYYVNFEKAEFYVPSIMN